MPLERLGPAAKRAQTRSDVHGRIGRVYDVIAPFKVTERLIVAALRGESHRQVVAARRAFWLEPQCLPMTCFSLRPAFPSTERDPKVVDSLGKLWRNLNHHFVGSNRFQV